MLAAIFSSESKCTEVAQPSAQITRPNSPPAGPVIPPAIPSGAPEDPQFPDDAKSMASFPTFVNDFLQLDTAVRSLLAVLPADQPENIQHAINEVQYCLHDIISDDEDEEDEDFPEDTQPAQVHMSTVGRPAPFERARMSPATWAAATDPQLAHGARIIPGTVKGRPTIPSTITQVFANRQQNSNLRSSNLSPIRLNSPVPRETL